MKKIVQFVFLLGFLFLNPVHAEEASKTAVSASSSNAMGNLLDLLGKAPEKICYSGCNRTACGASSVVASACILACPADKVPNCMKAAGYDEATKQINGQSPQSILLHFVGNSAESVKEILCKQSFFTKIPGASAICPQ